MALVLAETQLWLKTSYKRENMFKALDKRLIKEASN